MAASAAAIMLGVLLVCGGASAQSAGGAAEESPEVRSRLYRTIIRFVTDNDYPPFNYVDEDGTLTGFNVDMARAICLELDVACDVQQRDWKDHFTVLKRGDTDAIIASHALTPRNVREVDFTDRYYFTPARFAAKRGTLQRLDVTPVGLEGKRVGVIRNTAHDAYLQIFFRDCIFELFENAEAAREALTAGKVDLLFDDGISLSFWLNGTASKGCCEFRGGPFHEPRYFGDGVGIVVRKGDQEIKRLINLAIKRVRESGRYEELVQRYFPVKVN